MRNKYKTLVISPHCDDEVLGCGGAIYNRRENVFVYYLGIDVFHVVKRDIRVQEVEQVSKLLGFDYEIGANSVNNYDRKNMINEITDLINEVMPEEIFIPNPSYNQDHQEVYDACIIALRPHDRNHFIPKVYMYEVEQYLLWGENEFEPNYFEEINPDIKMKAYSLHASQVRSFRPPDMLKEYAHIRGLSSKLEYAEGFKILREVKK